MIQDNKPAAPLAVQNERAVWEKPEMRRLETGEAEGAAGAGNDNVVFS